MKVSRYNYYIEEEKYVICYNTLYDCFLLISNSDYVLLLSGNLELLRNKSEDLYDNLVKNGFVIEENVDEYELLKEEYDNYVYHSTNFELTLLPTLDCNLRCWYCYEKHKVGSRIQPGVQPSILKYIRQQFLEKDYLESLSVTMYGGEPLLYFKEELYPLLLALKELAEGLGKRVSFFFITNAVCINEELIPLFNNLNASFQISIDGYREKHNKVKFIPNTKEGTFDHVMKVVHLLTENLDNVYINLRINYDDNTLPHLTELIKEIDDIDRRKIGIHFERVWQTSCKLVNYNNKQLYGIIEEFINKGFKISYMNLSRKSLSCKSSSYNQLIISYDGKVYKCTGRDFTDNFSDGCINTDGSVSWKKEQVDRRMNICTFDNDQCRKCKFLPQCWGPCNQKLLESNNVSMFCPLKNMELELDDYIRLRLKNHYMQEQIRKNYEK